MLFNSRMGAKRTKKVRCDNCGRGVPAYDIVGLGSMETGYRDLCTRCFNTETAGMAGMEGFEHADFAPTEVVDCDGKAHVFHFRTRLCAPGLALDAFELRAGEPAGYQFALIGEPEGDPMALFARLIEKIRRALSVKHVDEGGLGLEITGQVVRGRIDWDEVVDGRVPLLVIDGQPITWDELGQMMMSFEGWQFKLELRDRSEEV